MLTLTLTINMRTLTAVRLFNRDLHRTRGLWDALQKQGYKEGDRIFTRAQVKTIVKYLGRAVVIASDSRKAIGCLSLG